MMSLLQTVEQCGGVDILISNAAVNPFFGNTMDSTEQVWDKVMQDHTRSLCVLSAEAVWRFGLVTQRLAVQVPVRPLQLYSWAKSI